MSIPTYLPAKQDGTSYLGSVIGKQNYQALPPSNPLTDQDNTLISPGFVDIANLGQTCPQVVIGFTSATTTGGLVLTYYGALWINATSTLPVMVRTGTGVYTFTLPATVSHEYTLAADNISNNITVNIMRATCNPVDTNCSPALASASGNVITVKLFDTTVTASDLAGANWTVIGY
jgi:hypothetical protein